MKKKKIISKLMSFLVLCIMVSLFCVPTFATGTTQTQNNNSSGTNGGNGTTGYGEDAFNFTFDENGNMQITTGGANGPQGFQGVVKSISNKFRMFCAGATGISILVIMLMLIIAFCVLGIKSNNVNERTKIGEGIFFKLAAVAGVVAVPMFIGLAANFFV